MIVTAGVPHRVYVEPLTLLPIEVEVDATAAWYHHALRIRGLSSDAAWRLIGEAYASPNAAEFLDNEITLRELGSPCDRPRL